MCSSFCAADFDSSIVSTQIYLGLKYTGFYRYLIIVLTSYSIIILLLASYFTLTKPYCGWHVVKMYYVANKYTHVPNKWRFVSDLKHISRYECCKESVLKYQLGSFLGAGLL